MVSTHGLSLVSLPTIILVFILGSSFTCSQALFLSDFSPNGCLDQPVGIATFRPMVEELESQETPAGFADYTGLPRGINQNTYAGTSVWNSRGMNLTQATLAMLGDPFAYFETALFTAYKMILLNQTAYIPDLVYDQHKGEWPTTDAGPWPNEFKYFQDFVQTIVPTLASSGLVDVGAGMREAQAVCRAKTLLDRRFSHLSLEDIKQTYLRGIEWGLGEDPYDSLYSSCYQGLNNEAYGPDVVVMAPDHRKRGVDLNLYQKRVCPNPYDYSEIMTPAYRFPDAILGYLVLNPDVQQWAGPGFFKAVEWAFVKVTEDDVSYVLVLGTMEMDHPVLCVDQDPAGRFVKCIPDSVYDFWNRCSIGPLPYHVLTNVRIPVIGVFYQALPGNSSHIENVKRRVKAQAVLARHREDGKMCNQTLRKPLNESVRAHLEGLLSTDREMFQVGLWTVDMVDDLDVAQPTPTTGNKTPGEPPLLVVVLMCLANAAGDLLQQRATRHHFPSARRYTLVSVTVSAILVLIGGLPAELLFPRQTGRVIGHGSSVQCYREDLAGVPGSTQAFCASALNNCTPVLCPAQGPSTIWSSIAAHPLLLLQGLFAVVFYLCEAVTHLHPPGPFFKPLASISAALVVVPLAHLLGYHEQSLSPYVILAGAVGTCLCLYGRPRGSPTEKYVELATLEELEVTGKAPTWDVQNLRPETGSETPEETLQMPGTLTWSNHATRLRGLEEVGEVRSSTGHQAVESEELDKHVLEWASSDPEQAELSRASKSASRGAVVKYVLLGVSFAILLTSSSIWAVVPRVVGDRWGVNAFGLTVLDQILAFLYMGAFLLITDYLPSPVRQALLPDVRDHDHTLTQAARQAAAELCASKCAALGLIAVERTLVVTRIATFFWLAVRFGVSSLLFELTVGYVSMRWLVELAVEMVAPDFIDKERFHGFKDARSRRAMFSGGLGTCVVILTLTLQRMRI